MIQVEFKKTPQILILAQSIGEKLGSYYAIHVRRGDRLERNKILQTCTRPQNIFNRIKNIIPLGEKLYILSNEWQVDYFDFLRNYYEVYQYFDFDELKELLREDNYYLYSVEEQILQNAKIKFDTFKPRQGGHPYYLCDEYKNQWAKIKKNM